MAIGQPFYTGQSFNGYTPYNAPYQPVPYQNVMQNQFQQPQMQQVQQNVSANDQIWVASEAAAEAYPLAPNGFVRLWDSNKQCFYEKRSDPTGRPYPMTIFDYTIRGTTPQTSSTPIQNTQTTAELEERIAALEERIAVLEKPSAAVQQNGQNNKREDNKK